LPVPAEPPVIEGLESPNVRAGETLRLLCVARGGNPPPSLHWDKDGTPLGGSWITGGPRGGSRSPLTLLVTPVDDGVTLRCRSPEASTSITLRVTYPPSEVTITGTPSVVENGSVTLSCSSAPSNPPVRLRWWLGGRQLVPSETSQSQAEGRGWVSVANVSIPGRREDHGRPLLCEAATAGMGTRSAATVLSVSRACALGA
ncbi:NPHN protein, partial [Rhinopomastus cyanomelas]|nr:NPHN protein [Rhinopomastus cyanomelas]